MKRFTSQFSRRVGIVGGVVVAAMSVVGPSAAQQDIPWFWNSGDEDARGKFESTGEHFYGQDHAGKGYIDWSASGYGSSRWYIPGASGTTYDLDQNFVEGRIVTMKVCQQHDQFPDDCEGPKNGVS